MAAERVVKVKLEMTSAQFVAESGKAAKAVQEVGTQSEKLAQKKQSFDLLGRSALIMGGTIAAGIGVAVAKFADFDAAMSNVEAATRESAGNMGLLREAALEAGATTVYSATEAATAVEELGKAGLTTADILGGALDGSMDLAAAGGLGVAEAAGSMATALKQFNLDGSDATHVADLLAAGAGKAMGDVTDLSAALNQAGLVANSTGLSIEETTASLAAFASKGLLGSDAGTSFKAMLQRLTPQSQEAKEKMDELGISAYDASGQFIGMEAFAGNLSTSLAGLTDEQRNSALATIFGSDAVRAANVLYEEGAAGIAEWTEKVDDSGFAAETAAIKLDNLKGDWEAFAGALDTALIGMGEAGDGPLRAFTQGLTVMVDGFNKLPAGGQQAVTWIGAVGAAVALAGGAYLLAVPKIAAYNTALLSMGPTAQKTGRILSGVGKAAGFLATMGLAVSVLDKLATSADKAAPGLELVLKSLTSNDLDGAFANASAGADSLAEALELVAGSSFDSWAENVGETLGGAVGITGQVTEAREGFVALDGALAQLVGDGKARQAASQFAELTEKAKAQGISVEKLKALFPEYANSLAGAENATTEMAEEAEVAEENLTGMRDALEKVGSTAFDMGAAVDDAQGAINALAEAAVVEGAAIDGANDESLALRDTMREVESTHRDAAQAILDNGGTLADARGEYEKGRSAIIDMLVAKGMDRAEADRWADATLGAASEVIGALGNVAAAVNNVPSVKRITFTAVTDTSFGRAMAAAGQPLFPSANGNMFSYADGGFGAGIYSGGTPLYKFAEKETGWEAFISGKPSERGRNIGVWQQAGERLGVGGAGGSGAPVTVKVYQLPGQDEDALVRKVASFMERKQK